MSSPTKLGAIVTQNSILRQLVRKAAAHQDIDRYIRSLIDGPLSLHISLESIRGNVLTLVADSSAWAAKARYQIPELHNLFKKNATLSQIRTIRIKVAASNSASIPNGPTPLAPLGPRTLAALAASAEQVRDPNLRAALLRLKRRGN